MHTIPFRPATNSDITFLLDLRRQTMDAHLMESGVVPTEEDHLARIQFEFDSAEIIQRVGEPVGLLKVVRRGKQWELVQIQLAPSVQGLGLGSTLLKALIDEARAQHATLSLSVLTANPARRLYERMGFTVTAQSGNAFEMSLR